MNRCSARLPLNAKPNIVPGPDGFPRMVEGRRAAMVDAGRGGLLR